MSLELHYLYPRGWDRASTNQLHIIQAARGSAFFVASSWPEPRGGKATRDTSEVRAAFNKRL
jgi:hypothetical protein